MNEEQVKPKRKTKRHERFASSLTPAQRSYIESYIDYQVETKVLPILTEAKALTAQYKALIDRIDTLQSSVDRYNNKFIDDTKYILTRAKIVALMKELNIK